MLSAPAAIRASESVKSQILSGALPGGELLSEGEVAQELGVSRTPVHEAFRRLEAEELLRLIPPGGAVVVPVSPREAVEVIELRRALETAAVRRLALAEYTAARVALAERLTALIGEQEQHAATGDVTGFAVVDEAFHRAIVTASENRLADRFYATLGDRQRRMSIGATAGRPAYLRALLDEHRRLAALVAAGDPASFDAALVAHLDTSR